VDRNSQIAELLRGRQYTLQQVADQFGLSRERVRQIAVNLGVKVRRDRHRGFEDEIRREFRRVFGDLIRKCASLGLTVKPVPHPKVRGSRIYQHFVEVSGRKCFVVRLGRKKTTGALTLRGLSPNAQGAEFVLARHQNFWMVIPRDRMPRTATSFSVRVRHPKFLARSHRHDWRLYIGAWGPLRRAG
jgi:Sigma-70, region 4